MEMFILKLIGIICITALAMSIVISRKNDIDIWAILLATIFELLSFLIIYIKYINFTEYYRYNIINL